MDPYITHWGRVTHVCVGKLIIIGSNNGLSPGRRQAIIWTNDGILLIGPLGTNSNAISIGIQTFSFKKMPFKVSSAKWRPFCLSLNVLIGLYCTSNHNRYGKCKSTPPVEHHKVLCRKFYNSFGMNWFTHWHLNKSGQHAKNIFKCIKYIDMKKQFLIKSFFFFFVNTQGDTWDSIHRIYSFSMQPLTHY